MHARSMAAPQNTPFNSFNLLSALSFAQLFSLGGLHSNIIYHRANSEVKYSQRHYRHIRRQYSVRNFVY